MTLRATRRSGGLQHRQAEVQYYTCRVKWFSRSIETDLKLVIDVAVVVVLFSPLRSSNMTAVSSALFTINIHRVLTSSDSHARTTPSTPAFGSFQPGSRIRAAMFL